MDQIILEPKPEPKILRWWSRRLKFGFRLYSPG